MYSDHWILKNISKSKGHYYASKLIVSYQGLLHVSATGK